MGKSFDSLAIPSYIMLGHIAFNFDLAEGFRCSLPHPGTPICVCPCRLAYTSLGLSVTSAATVTFSYLGLPQVARVGKLFHLSERPLYIKICKVMSPA